MVLSRLHWSLMATRSSDWVLFKTQYITLHSYAGILGQPSTGAGVCSKGSQKRYIKGRVACSRMMTQQSVSQSFKDVIEDPGKRCSFYSLTISGFPGPRCSSSRLFSTGIKPTCETFGTRMFSVKATPQSDLEGTSTNKDTFTKDSNARRDLSKYFAFGKHRKRNKAISSRGSTERKFSTFAGKIVHDGIADCRVSTHKNVNAINSSEVLLKDGLKEAKSTESLSSSSIIDGKGESKIESKPKQKSQNRKKKEELSDTPSSLDAGREKSSKKVKTPNSLSQQTTEVSSLFSSRKSPQKPIPAIIYGIKSIKLKPLYPPAGKSVVVVESQTKAKVIQRYLGDMYDVLPSYGHIRDLAARSGSVRPDDDFSMVWEVPPPAWNLKSIKTAISSADNLILASDPDQEGEAIAWHIIEMLQQQDALHKDITVARVSFQEITESAIKSALKTPRDIDINLVHAYLARRALDYLIGFNISPLLWRKLPGCLSAGRVQSAALSLLCDREMEIEEFKLQEYWSVEATFSNSEGASLSGHCSFRSYLTHFDSRKLSQLSIGSETEAKSVEQIASSTNFKVIGAKRSEVNRNPPSPYITSTLQQDAANKLKFSAAYMMKLAQKLYEGVDFADGKAAGLITYMRTDGLHISDEAVKDICSLVTERYGLEYAASSPRKFFMKVKNAQEAHEAIRPTDIRRLPSMLIGAVDDDSLKLYTLIWARTMAYQMEAAKVDQIQLDIGNVDGSISFRAACSTDSFPGFRLVYEDVETKTVRDSENEATDRDELFKILSKLKEGDPLSLGNMELKQHHTHPPPRYSEASLVKKLEELGIGRPSTYASTIKVLQDRKYVTLKNRALFPEFRGRMVSAFLSHYFTEVTDYSFTADMETELHNVSAGSTEWKDLLKDYWSKFSTYCDRAGKVHIHQVEKMLERSFENFLFSSLPNEGRTCPSCLEGTLIFKVYSLVVV